LAVGLVVAFHGAERLFPGGFVGVDVFFVISGFLITGLLLREIASTGRISLSRFWSRRMKRLLPAAAAALAAAAAITVFLLPVTQRRVFGWDIISAAGYFINWRLSDRSVDYMAEDVGSSPVQHFWSLAVEEQFYVIWPLLIVAILWLAHRLHRNMLTLLRLGIAFLVLGSMIVSVAWTEASRATAFFATPTRIWELGLGAILALLGPVLHTRSRWLFRFIGIIGIAMILASAFILSSATPWPSLWALLPCGGAALVIVAGQGDSQGGVSALLSLRPLVWVGGLSYSIYLWHWLFLAGARGLLDDDLGIKRSALVIATSLIPAWLINRILENPIRFSQALSSSVKLALSVGLNFTLIGGAAGLAVVASVVINGAGPATQAPGDGVPMGAAAIKADGSNAEAVVSVRSYPALLPDPLLATQDRPSSYDDPCRANDGKGNDGPCIDGDPNGAITVAAIGDSLMQQWEPALDIIGKQHSIRFEVWIMHECPFSASTVFRETLMKPFTRCTEWTRAALDQIKASEPTLLLTTQSNAKALPQSKTDPDDQTEQVMISGMHEYWDELFKTGIPVALIARNPWTTLGGSYWGGEAGLYECAAANREDLTRCVGDEAENETLEMQERAVREYSGTVPIIDINNYICPAGKCAAVIGGVVVYREGSHMTKSYVESLAPMLWSQLVATLPQLGSP
jgi:peptidoglycan/LPS O-acetylase OafA/YrhL